MRDRLIQKFTKAKKGSLGYTLTEMLVVVGIIVALLAIAIPSVITISKALQFRQRNDYAKSIFLAAQANLTEMRSDGGLAPLQGGVNDVNSLGIPSASGFPVEEYSDEYVYTASDLGVTGSQRDTYALVLPAGSVDSQLREQHVIIEYNPITGNVFSVFYCEDDLVKGTGKTLLELYNDGALPRDAEGDKELRKGMMVGYYDGSGLSSSRLEVERTKAELDFDNGEEGILTVMVPMPDLYVGAHEDFMEGLKVELTLTPERELTEGETALPEIDLLIKEAGDISNCTLDTDGRTVLITYVLDSLVDCGSFANLSAEARTPGAGANSLTEIMEESEFAILPGQNITINAEVDFVAPSDRPAVTIEPAVLDGVNPMFAYLEENLANPGTYTLAVANGRNLQNLNAIAPSVADTVSSVVFVDDIYWNQTVAYYNAEHGVSGTYNNSPSENPARALPYFVPINNTSLFGIAKVNCDERTVSGFINFTTSADVPTMSDEEDTDAANHAKISGMLANGNAVRVFNLNIDATKYTIPNNTLPSNPTDEQRILQGHYYVTAVNLTHPVSYEFSGLFGYVNTTIDSVHVVNPIVKGYPFVDSEKRVFVGIWLPIIGNVGRWENMTVYGSPSTGALVGATGYNAQFSNCATYIDTTDASFDRARMTQGYYNKDADQTWYGVSGEGAVGGLVGYAKSHRTTTGVLDGDMAHLAFSHCFAAVNVSGNMRGNEQKHFGYTNGVGGLIGNSELTNFYNCYASGNVRANGCYVDNTTTSSIANAIAELFGQKLDLLYNGRTSMGAGGFVGSSHGTRYTNCFATGNVSANAAASSQENKGAGGFVGIMSYEETYSYGNDDANNNNFAQHTVFENCYAAGVATLGGVHMENFSGANARIKLKLLTSGTYLVGSYYRALAPYYCGRIPGYGTGSYPAYETMYIFKDAYYLAQYENTLQDNSNKCATVESYENLTKLHTAHRDLRSLEEGGWVQTQIENIKDIYLYQTYEKVEDNWLIDKYDWVKHYYRDVYFDATPALEGVYRNQYGLGFPAEIWGNITTAQTHPYSLTYTGQAYPFSMIMGLPYYGDWPTKPAYAGIAYYEDYADAENTTGYYFNNDESSTLKNDQVIENDGYAILSANATDVVTVTINGVTRTLTCDTNQYKPGGLTAVAAYSVFRIPSDMYENLMHTESDSYYVTANVAIKTGDETKYYTMYFNPFTAISQVVGADTAPTEVPTEIYIRTARQFAGLSAAYMGSIWDNEDVKITQQLHIDASKYDWDNDGSIEDNTEAVVVGAIGDAENPFQATYTGNGGYVSQAELKGFLPETAFFGNVGTEGQVNNLMITITADENVQIGSEDADYAAVLAAVSAGTIDNVDVTISGNGRVDLIAKKAAGVLVGNAAGTDDARAAIKGCNVTVKNLGIDAPNAGGAVGRMTQCDVSSSTTADGLEDNSSLTISGKFAAIADAAGGFLGLAEDVTVDTLILSIQEAEAEADLLGGFAGSFANGSVSNVELTLAGKFSVTNEEHTAIVAGAIADAQKAEIQNLSVTLDTQGVISGDTAAGAFGNAKDLTVQNTTAVLKGDISGTSAAAGMAAAIEGGTFSGSNVELNGSVVTADGEEGRAAGYAVAVKGAVQNATVSMTGDNSVVGTKEAAGFACEISADVSGSRVAGMAKISSDGSAAGFAVKITGKVDITGNGVTPALTNTKEHYAGNSNENLSVSGTDSAALFALEIGKEATVTNCYVLGTASGENIAGFALKNAGTINGATANVTVSGGYGFVAENTGTIINSYGWYDLTGNTAASADPDTETSTGTITSSYFVDLSVEEPDSEKCIVLYNAKSERLEMFPDDLKGAQAILNSGSTRWLPGAAYSAYPYGNYKNPDYPYPMLRVHYGNWITPPLYSYGVVYYEKIDGNYEILQIVDMSDETENVGKGNYITTNKANNSGVITEAGYAVFYSGLTSPFTGASISADPIQGLTMSAECGAAFDGNNGNMPKSAANYKFYAVTNQGTAALTVKATDTILGTTQPATLIPGYAMTIGQTVNDAQNPYIIRTESQLNNVKDSGYYKQTHDITMSGNFTGVTAFAGIYNGNGMKLDAAKAENGWMNGVSGSVTGLNLNVGELNASFFGDISTNGTVSLDALTIAGVGEDGSIAKTVSGTLTLPAVTIGGNVNSANGFLENVNGTLNCTAITVKGDVAGKLIGTVGENATTDLSSITVTGTVNGKVFGNVAGTLSNLTFDYSGDLPGTFADTVSGTVSLTNSLSLGSVNTLFGTVSGNVTLKNVTANAVTGKLVGTVRENAEVKTGAITVNNGATALTTKLFASVAGTLETGSVSVGAIGANGAVVGESSGTVKTKSITTGAIAENGMVFGDMKHVTTEAIETGAVAGQIFGDVSGEVETGDITLVAMEKVPVETEPTSEPAESSTPAETTEPQYKDKEVPQALSGQIFGKVEGEVTTGKISAGDVSGKLFGEIKADVTVGGIKTTGAVTSSLITKLTSGTMTTGTIDVASLGAPLVGTFEDGTLQGIATAESGETVPVTITIGNSAMSQVLFAEKVGGTVKNYAVEVSTAGAGLTNELSGTMNNVALTVNGDLAVDVIKKFTNTTTALDGLTVQVNGNMSGHLIETAAGTVKNLNLTVTGDMTVDVITTAKAVEGLNVTVGEENVNGTMSGRLLGSADSVSASSLTVNGNLAPKTGETAADVIGEVSGAVNAVEIHVTGDLTGNAVTKATSATGLTVDVDGNMSANALGTVGDVTTLNLTVDGTLKASAIGNAGGNLSGVTVEADTVEVTTEGDFGVITAQLASGKTLSGSSVTVDNVNITVGADGSIGGLVGVNKGTIETSTVSAALNITAGESSAANVGGLAGTNGGAMTLSAQSDVTINYTQKGNDSVTIGGIVGVMNGGSLTGNENTTVISGAINLTGTASAKYVVGGAVGKDNITEVNDTVEYKTVKATVAIDSDWAAATTNKTADCPAGVGSVGMFVGYAHSGTFTNNYSEVKNTLYEFVGKVYMDPVTLSTDLWASDDNYAALDTTSEEEITATSLTIAVDEETSVILNKLTENNNKIGYVRTNLSNCTFVLGNEVREQILGVDQYIYSMEQNGKSEFEIKQPSTVSFNDGKTYTIEVNTSTEAISQKRFTGYYYKISENTYSKLYEQSTRSGTVVVGNGSRTFNYKFTYIDVDGTEQVHPSSEEFTLYVTWLGSQTKTIKLEELSTLAELKQLEGKYLVVAGDFAVTDGNSESIKEITKFREKDELYNYVYIYKNSSLSKGEETHKVTIYDETLSTVPTYTVGTLKLGNVDKFMLYPLTEEQNAYFEIEFTQKTDDQYVRQKVTSEKIGDYVATTSLDDEANLPGETGEVPEGTEATEPTEVTEPVTEPGTNE